MSLATRWEVAVRPRVRWVSVPITVVIATLLLGCEAGTPADVPQPTLTSSDNGVTALPAAEILEKAKATLAGAENVHLNGSSAARGAVTFDIRITGTDYSGTIEEGGARIEYIQLGTDLYVRASDEFWTHIIAPTQRTAAATLSGKYAHIDLRDSRLADRRDDLGIDLDELFEEILEPYEALTKGAITAIGTTPAIPLVAGEGEWTLFVSTVGKPLPLRVKSELDQGTVTFTYEAFHIAPPPKADVVELAPAMLIG